MDKGIVVDGIPSFPSGTQIAREMVEIIDPEDQGGLAWYRPGEYCELCWLGAGETFHDDDIHQNVLNRKARENG